MLLGTYLLFESLDPEGWLYAVDRDSLGFARFTCGFVKLPKWIR